MPPCIKRISRGLNNIGLHKPHGRVHVRKVCNVQVGCILRKTSHGTIRAGEVEMSSNLGSDSAIWTEEVFTLLSDIGT